VHAAPELQRHGQVSRDDVAAAVLAALQIRQTHNQSFDLLEGDTPVEEALKGLDGSVPQ
jgi:hypothetical protein